MTGPVLKPRSTSRTRRVPPLSLALDPSSPEPLHRQIGEQMRRAILEGSTHAHGGFHEHLVGDTLPFEAREQRTPAFVLELQVLPGRHTHYLRVSSQQAFMTPIELWRPEAFQLEAQRWAAYYGMFYGILLVMVLYNGLVWLWTREANYAWYCLYLLAFSLMNASYSGFAFQFFWPQSPAWSNQGHTHFIFTFQVIATLFSMTFLDSKTRLPRLNCRLTPYASILPNICWTMNVVLPKVILMASRQNWYMRYT